MQLQEHQAWPPQLSMIAAHGAMRTSTTKQLLLAKMANTITLPVGALVADNIEDKGVVGLLMGLGLNMAALPREVL